MSMEVDRESSSSSVSSAHVALVAWLDHMFHVNQKIIDKALSPKINRVIPIFPQIGSITFPHAHPLELFPAP